MVELLLAATQALEVLHRQLNLKERDYLLANKVHKYQASNQLQVFLEARLPLNQHLERKLVAYFSQNKVHLVVLKQPVLHKELVPPAFLVVAVAKLQVVVLTHSLLEV